MRPFSDQQYRSLKSIATVGYDAVRGATIFAQMTRVVVSQLSKYASFNRQDAKSFMPIDVAVDLDRAAKQPIITGQMAALLGYRLVPDDEAPPARLPVDEMMAHEILCATMDVTRALIDARRDGRIDALEHKTILGEAHEARQALDQLIFNMEGGQ